VYDLLERLGCVQDTAPAYSPTGACSGGNPYIVNTYDSNKLTISGTTDYPVGQLTQSVSTTYFSGSAASVTESYEHDARGRSIGEQLQFSLPSSWNVTTALPSYLAQSSYNDADQLTTTTTSTNPTGQGFTTTQVYDSATGVKTGLSNNGTATANLATLSYASSAQLASLNFLTSTGGALSTDTYGYDGNLRLSSLTATWGANSGNSGTYFSQGLTYDPASNLTSLATTQAAVTGNSNTGGSETQVFCYDEQNRLLWAGNSGTPTCTGNGTPAVSGHIGAYNASYVYTHLGQLWQGPLNAGSTQYQYLYCSSSQPHQLTGLYPSGTTCSNLSGAVYSSSYDSWGNVIGRTYSSTTATLSYDLLDHLTKWNVSSTNRELYVYDASGERVLRRTTTGSGTTMIVYAFGLEEHTYGGAGAHQSDTYYYNLGGRLLGALDSSGTTFYMTDALGSVLASFTNVASSAAVKGNQVFGPYGTPPYAKGTINTAKGFTGQYNDGLTGLDYFNARYYDPVVGVFLSADTVQGNLQGMNPYAYVNGNPETHSDPTGLRPISACPTGGCNAPVDMGALTAAIHIWANGSSSTTQGSGGLDQRTLTMHLQGLRIAYMGVMSVLDYYVLHNQANLASDLLSLAGGFNAPVPDLGAFPFWAGRLSSDSSGRIYGMLQQYIGDELLSGFLNVFRKGFEGLSILYFVLDFFQTNDVKQKVADALSAIAFTASLLRKSISDILGVDEESVAQFSVIVGGIAVAMQLPDWLASASQFIRDNSGDKRNRRSAGGGPPWIPPTIPPFPNLNNGDQGPLGPEVGPEVEFPPSI
jgi:RHS repeat-associated protein